MLERFTNPDHIEDEQRRDAFRDFASALTVAWHSEPHYKDVVIATLLHYIQENADSEALVKLTDQIRDRTWRRKNPLRQEMKL